MKYNKGDKVEYIASTGEYVECRSCGHETWKEQETTAIGTITHIKVTDQYYSSAMFNYTDDIKIHDDGTMAIIPKIESIKAKPKIAFYSIDKQGGFTEKSIIRKVE